MKVLFDHQIFLSQRYGGISRYFNEVLKADGIRAEVISTDIFSVNSRYTLVERIANKARVLAGTYDSYLLRKKYPKQLFSLLDKGEYDIFHPTYYDTYFLNYIKSPFVVTVYDMIHELYPESFIDFDIVSSNKRILCDKASHILAISQTTKNDLVDLFNINPNKITVTLLASDFSSIDPSPIGNNDLSDYILFTGVRAGYKNFYFFVRSIRELLIENKHLSLVCTGASFNKQELKLFEDLGISRKVKHVTIHNDNQLAWLYKQARCFVFPSLYEGFGIPLLEAFAMGCPVASSNAGSLSEVGMNAPVYFNPKNYTEIQSAIASLLYNESARKDAINKGYVVFQQYSWDRCRKETESVYLNIK